MGKNKQKLELTWIGKDDEYKDIEPRILVEVPEKSYGDKNTENMLIHGDNLLALKALEQDYSGKIKCIYIDPPYNTGSAFEHYDDNVEHSKWLSLMKQRLEILKQLLTDNGILWISIDNDECHYLKVLCDEVFGRNNFISDISVKMSTASGVKTSHRGKTIIKEKESVLVYSKSKGFLEIKPQYIPKLEWDSEFQYFLEKNGSNNQDNWEVKKLKEILDIYDIDNNSEDKQFQEFVINNADKIWRRAFIRGPFKELSQKNPEKIFYNKDAEKEHYYYRGREMYFYKDKFHDCFTENGWNNFPSHLLCDFWSDINTGKLFNEGGIDFRNGKKPEFLIARILEMSTNEGDLVLDSFLGSGTTAAVAHKMNRKWIGIELGDHCYTHCEPRLHQVVDGTDQGGISKAVEWKGGGGYKFYELAPSLLKKDEFDNWIIEPKYDAEMLAEAMAKHEGYKFSPDENNVYKQGYSTEKDFIFTTTQFLSLDLLNKIASRIEEDESLLICATHFEEGVGRAFSNITVKKIPQMLLDRCEFGKLEYNLNIIEETQPEDFDDEEILEDEE